jgi:thiol:disulfide interchange protein DsbD
MNSIFHRLSKGILVCVALLIAVAAHSQILKPVKWSYFVNRTSDQEAELVLKASIDAGWHLYSQSIPEGGPIATSFKFSPSKDYELVGKVKEGKPIKKYEEAFEMDLQYFESSATFKQKIKIKTADAFKINGTLEFMVCNDQQCLPPEEKDTEFSLEKAKSPVKLIEQGQKDSSNNTSTAKTQDSGTGNLNASSQLPAPVKWSYRVNRTSDGEAELIVSAAIEKGWHLYSQFIPEGLPVSTVINFSPSKEYELVGKVEEGKPIKKYEEVFGMEVQYFEDSATFKQKIKIGSEEAFKIKGTLKFTVCNEEQCLPPEERDIEFSVEKAGKNIANEAGSEEEPRSLWATFLLSFFGGFAAIIMPCIFPMIPLTVSFFTKQSKNRKKGLFNAFMYGLFIIGIYVLLGLLITIIFGDEALNKISSNEWMNLFFFIIFIIFGISFLGAFEITLPASWVNKADAASEKGGMIGIFFMAFTLSLVSFSCTGPIIGSLLVEASHGGRLGPAVGMFGFSLALALPFTLFAAFPGWLSSLPKSGGWLNNVKVVLGLLELAFALKFLSVTDLQGLHIDFLDFHINGPLGILKREVFIALWIVIFALIGFYLLGKLKFSHDSEQSYISVPKIMLAIIAFGFVVYLIPGMWGAPLKLISGFPPPSFHSEGWSGGGNSGHNSDTENSKDSLAPPVSAHCPHNLNCFNDYDEALAYAKKVNKPLMIDFTGWACVNCRKMEENVWIDPAVLKRIKNDFVLVSLYVDESTPLPADKQYESKITGRKVKTIGNKWAEFQASRYNKISQPWYVLLDHNEKELAEGRGYDTNISAYIEWLDNAKGEFKKRTEVKAAP